MQSRESAGLETGAYSRLMFEQLTFTSWQVGVIQIARFWTSRATQAGRSAGPDSKRLSAIGGPVEGACVVWRPVKLSAPQSTMSWTNRANRWQCIQLCPRADAWGYSL